MDIPSLPPTEFPPALSIKKANAWLIAHPEISGHPLGPFAFWSDQVAKWDVRSKRSAKNARIWMVISFSFIGGSLILRIISEILRANGL